MIKYIVDSTKKDKKPTLIVKGKGKDIIGEAMSLLDTVLTQIVINNSTTKQEALTSVSGILDAYKEAVEKKIAFDEHLK